MEQEIETLHERFSREPVSRRLNGLAGLFGHISSSARKSDDPDAIVKLLEEASRYIEWTAAEAEPAIAAELDHIQRIISMWKKSWPTASRLPQQRTLLAAQTKNWSDKIVKFSKLV
ncbi:MAG: hypothetical protein ACOYZ6_12200 [Chloroflexota bacterium]